MSAKVYPFLTSVGPSRVSVIFSIIADSFIFLIIKFFLILSMMYWLLWSYVPSAKRLLKNQVFVRGTFRSSSPERKRSDIGNPRLSENVAKMVGIHCKCIRCKCGTFCDRCCCIPRGLSRPPNTGATMPRIGCGTYTLKGDTAAQAVSTALERGIRPGAGCRDIIPAS